MKDLPDLPISFDGKICSSFVEALGQCVESGRVLKQIRSKRQVYCIEKHLRLLECKSVVVETKYVDHDFLEDYSAYYVRCFRLYNRTCIRLHCFAEQFTASDIEHIIVGQDKETTGKAKDSYLGFIVIRPLQNTIIGKTCLVPCKLKHCDKFSFFKALCKIEVSFFGLGFCVECMPFQEQDKIVSTCATSALWSALNITSKRFYHAAPSPAKISILAKQRGVSLRRAIPNRYGLSANEMAYVIRNFGLDVLAVDFHHMLPSIRKNSLLGNLYAYLNLGVPVLLLGEFRKEGKSIGKHAVVVNGYKIRSAANAVPILPEERLYACTIIKEIFVNDDGVGPYVNMEIPEIRRGSVDMLTLWHGGDEIQRSFEVQYLLVPVYDKIRVSYEEVWNMAYPFDSMAEFFVSSFKMKWRIRLVRSNDFKKMLRERYDISEKDRFDVLRRGMPKYLWEIAVIVDNVENAIFCVDATDAGQGINIVLSIFLYVDLLKIADVLQQMGCFDARPNAICEECIKALRSDFSQDEFHFAYSH